MAKMKAMQGILIKFSVAVALCLIYACSCVLNLIWKLGLVYTLSTSFAASFIVGILLMDFKSTLFCVCISLVLGSAVAALILVMPVMIEEPVKFDLALTVALSSVAKILILNMGASIAGSLFGIILGGKL